MTVIEIPTNPNCAAVDMRVFHELEAPRPVGAVRLERELGRARWYAVTGWTTAGTPVAALAQKVDDSGDGIALLLRGGDAGLRLRPTEHQGPWQLGDPRQWGEPFLMLADANDVRMV